MSLVFKLQPTKRSEIGRPIYLGLENFSSEIDFICHLPESEGTRRICPISAVWERLLVNILKFSRFKPIGVKQQTRHDDRPPLLADYRNPGMMLRLPVMSGQMHTKEKPCACRIDR